MRTAILLIAHGSRQAEANGDLLHLAEQLRATGRYALVEPAFLELAEPTIEQAGQRCAEQFAERVILLPYFLSAGVHFRRDLEGYRQRLAQAFPEIDVRLAEPLGRHRLLLDIALDRASEAEAPSAGGART